MPRAHVDLDAVASNLAALRARLAAAGRAPEVLAALKANAYGHGAVPVARRLAAEGVRWFGLATPAEALEALGAAPGARALLFSPVRDGIGPLAEAGVRFTVASRGDLDALVAASARARVHVKVDTGMGRLGERGDAARALVRACDRAAGVDLEGVWTHFARADERDRTPTALQLDRFAELLGTLERDGLRPPLVHAANSAGTIAFPEAAFDLVRPGIALYGYAPGPGALEPRLRPALRVDAPVTFVKRVRPGESVSYGGAWTAARATTVATVRFGYADGYPRALSGRGVARLDGELVPVVGRVCMDQLMIDAGDRDVRPGDRVDLLHPDGPDADDLAGRVGTISYEILTSIAARVERTYAGASGPA